MISSRVVSRKGGVAFLEAVGFKSTSGIEQKSLTLDESYCGGLLEQTINDSIHWLSEIVQTCQEMIGSLGRKADEPCAPYIVQIRLPTGQSVQGGFTADDELEDLVCFARCFFVEDRREFATLRFPDEPTPMEGERLHQTLAEAALARRVVLLASTRTVQEQFEMMQRTAIVVEHSRREDVEKRAKMKRDKLALIEARKREREIALQSFKDDRSDQRERRERLARLSVNDVSVSTPSSDIVVADAENDNATEDLQGPSSDTGNVESKANEAGNEEEVVPPQTVFTSFG